ncbi:pilus assembly protein PilX [Shewanella indica]|nr:pilus assembly protein PilX [Shewanella indica]
MKIRQQRGVVLFFALILLIILTLIGVALAVNSSQSLRMAGAGAERVEAKALADGGLHAVITEYAGAPFANVKDEVGLDRFYGKQVISPLPETGVKDVSCQRTSNATGANLVSCRRFQITSTVSYGRDSLGSLTVASGVEQQILTGN